MFTYFKRHPQPAKNLHIENNLRCQLPFVYMHVGID